MSNLHLSVVDVWDDGSRTNNSWGTEDFITVLDTMGRVEAQEWQALVSSTVWLVEENPGQEEEKILIWQWSKNEPLLEKA